MRVVCASLVLAHDVISYLYSVGLIAVVSKRCCLLRCSLGQMGRGRGSVRCGQCGAYTSRISRVSDIYFLFSSVYPAHLLRLNCSIFFIFLFFNSPFVIFSGDGVVDILARPSTTIYGKIMTVFLLILLMNGMYIYAHIGPDSDPFTYHMTRASSSPIIMVSLTVT